MALLEVQNLKTWFKTQAGIVRAVDGISFSLEAGKTLALVGESGCGKSVTSLSIMGLIASPPGYYAAGQILFSGKDLLKLSEKEMCKLRGKEIALIFQDPGQSLNPVFTCGTQVAEGIQYHQGLSHKAAMQKTVALFKEVGIADPERRVKEYPHEMSGGMRQRVAIAMALACRPKLLIADEPTTSLDVTVQAQILTLLKELCKKNNMALLLITHDLGVVSEMADDVAVMYAGKIVEQASLENLFQNPQHSYTQGLLASILDIGEA